MSLLLLSPLLLLQFVSAAAASPASPPELLFTAGCPSITFNSLYQRYQLQLPLSVDASRWRSEAELQSLQVSADAALSKSGLSAVAQVDSSHAASVLLLCSSFRRCSDLRTQAASDPSSFAAALRFRAVFHDGARRLRQISVTAQAPASSLLAPSCNTGWVVFQQRLDGSLSFRQNWESYARGFGNPNGNYWMGLHNLHSSLRAGLRFSPCRLRIEVTAVSGRKYWGEWKHFYVEEESRGFRLTVSSPIKGSQIINKAMLYQNGMKFTTYDRDNDRWRHNCSRRFGFGGWWYRSCHYVNLNGEYPNSESPKWGTFASIHLRDHGRSGYRSGYRLVKKTKMMFRCEPALAKRQ